MKKNISKTATSAVRYLNNSYSSNTSYFLKQVKHNLAITKKVAATCETRDRVTENQSKNTYELTKVENLKLDNKLIKNNYNDFRILRSSWQTAKQTNRRYIHINPEMFQREKVLFVSNAGIYALFWALTKSSHREQHLKNLSSMHVFYRKPWFVNIHPTHNNNIWGQSPMELPTSIRELCLNEVEQTELDKPLTFGQIGNLHKTAVDVIKSIFAENHIDGKFTEISDDCLPSVLKDDNRYNIRVNDSNFNVGSEPFFYNWLRSFRQHNWNTQDMKLAQRYVADIYQLPKNIFLEESTMLKNIVVQGASVTVPWILRDFPGVGKIAVLKRKEDNIKEIPRNKDIPLDEVVYFTLSANGEILTQDNCICNISPVDSGGNLVCISYEENNKKIDFFGHYYVGMGTEPAAEITKEVADNDKLDLPTTGSYKWVAPKNIPSESLTESFLLFLCTTENIQQDTHEPQLFHKDNFRRIFASRFLPGGIISGILNNSFFPEVEKYIEEELVSPLNQADFHDFFQKKLHDSLQLGLKDTVGDYTKKPRIFRSS